MRILQEALRGWWQRSPASRKAGLINQTYRLTSRPRNPYRVRGLIFCRLTGRCTTSTAIQKIEEERGDRAL